GRNRSNSGSGLGIGSEDIERPRSEDSAMTLEVDMDSVQKALNRKPNELLAEMSPEADPDCPPSAVHSLLMTLLLIHERPRGNESNDSSLSTVVSIPPFCLRIFMRSFHRRRAVDDLPRQPATHRQF